MDEYKTDKAVYTVNDFVLWQENEILVITPKFQRRPVWKTPARSYFIDTLLRGMTVPPLYFRMTQNPAKTKMIREVVDGQQRVRSVLEFISDGYRLSKTLKATWAGRKFSLLTEAQKLQITSFGFTAEIFKGISDKQVLEVFCRLNMNGVPLNKQELRNGKFFGFFKQTSFELALTYLQFWRQHKIFTEQSIARMLEVELTSELLIAGNKGMQDKKTSLDTFYSDWEESYPTQARDEKRFKETMLVLSEAFVGDLLAESAFRRPPLFYTLYCVVHHCLFGLPGVNRVSPKKKLNANERDSLREAVEALSEKIAGAKDPTIETPARGIGESRGQDGAPAAVLRGFSQGRLESMKHRRSLAADSVRPLRL
jgi:hypothetical protein